MIGRWTWVGFAAVCVHMAGCQPEARPEPLEDRVAEVKSPAAKSAGDRFWQYWSDGKAELSGYDLIQPRYGQNRHGRAALVFVTEPYSRSKKVKVDRYDRDNPDHTLALKLNVVRKFQTGIYDYSVMTSVFTDPTQGFAPMEITFSMQEWCGHVFEEAHFGGDTTVSLNSYFEGESGKNTLERPEGFVAEDALFVALRGLASEALERKDMETTMLGSATTRRLRHMPAKLFKSSIAWAEEAREVEVPAGKFQVHEATWTRQDKSTCTAQVEVPYPHRLVGWRCTDGEVAKLTGSTRLAYWGTHGEGDEKLLTEMGLSPTKYAP